VNVLVYVDDLMFTGPEKEANETCDLIEAEFGDCKRRTGLEFDFLGMHFKIDNDKVSVKIDLSKTLEHTSGSSDTPAPNNILAVTLMLTR